MVKRLIDEQGLDYSDELLADLFRAAEPFEADPFRKRRVLVSMSRVQARGVSHFWLRPVIVATLLVSGTATAALGHRYVAHGTGFFGFGPPAVANAAPSVKVAPAVTRRATSQVAASSAPDDRAETVDPVAAEAVDPPPTAAHPASRSVAHAHPDSSEDATHVVEAIQALRTDRDPSRAQGLLSDYLKTHPHGVLSEDALALSIEAASAQHDPRAADYARRYLAKFPHGKYRDLANRAVAQQQR
jgi:hypothetical protein